MPSQLSSLPRSLSPPAASVSIVGRLRPSRPLPASSFGYLACISASARRSRPGRREAIRIHRSRNDALISDLNEAVGGLRSRASRARCTISVGVPSMSTITPSSSAVGGSRVSIWEVSIEAGMKWSDRSPCSALHLPWPRRWVECARSPRLVLEPLLLAQEVQSDFWSCRSCAPSLNAGMDHEMPAAKWLNETNVKAALSDTSLEIETIDRALVRRYTQMFRFGQFERPYDPGEIDAQAHGDIARTIGSQIAVLLKNDRDLLPLDPN